MKKSRLIINFETVENFEQIKDFKKLLAVKGQSLNNYLLLLAENFINRNYFEAANILTQSEVLLLAKKMRLRLEDSELCNFRKRKFTEGIEFIRKEIDGRTRYFYVKKEMIKFFKRLKAKRRTAKKNAALKKLKSKESIVRKVKTAETLPKVENIKPEKKQLNYYFEPLKQLDLDY